MSSNVTIPKVAMYVPSFRATNQWLSENFLTKSTKNPRIISRITGGIEERRFVSEDESGVDMAVNAILDATPAEVGRVSNLYYVINTPPPDFNRLNRIYIGTTAVDFPSIKPTLVELLGNHSCFEKSDVDIRLGGCADFLSVLIDAYKKIQSDLIENAVIATGVDISRNLDPSDRKTALIFGDGACAAFLTQDTDGNTPRVLAHYDELDTSLSKLLYYERNHKDRRWYVRMPDGKAVSDAVVEKVELARKDLESKGYSFGNIDHFIFHQANGNVIKGFIDRYNLRPENIHQTFQNFGNTSAASAGITWSEASPKIKQGETVLLCAYGAGFRCNYVFLQY